jgi:hypothetical protein
VDIEFDEDRRSFFVDAPSWETTVAIGQDMIFAVNSALNAAQIVSLEQVVKVNNAFGNLVSSEVVTFETTATAHVPIKQMPVASVGELLKNFEFGFVQGMKAGDVHVEYWGRSAKEGRTVVHFDMPNQFEVDTATQAQPFTRVPKARSKVTLLPPIRRGFHSFKIVCGGGDHPQVFLPNRQFFKGTKDFVAREHLFRSITHRLDFLTTMVAFDKAAKKFIGISATGWQANWRHVASYTETLASGTGAKTLTSKVTGPSGKAEMPTGGAPSNVDLSVRSILKTAAGPGPFVNPEVIRQRLSKSIVSQEDVNPDFESSFFSRS